MTTSFNVALDLSQMAAFNSAVGFTRADVVRAIDECLGYSERSPESEAMLTTLTRWCDGYLFAEELETTEGVFQSAMVVLLLNEVRARRDNSLTSLADFLARWVPGGAVAPEPDLELLDFYAPSAAMVTLVPKLSLGRVLAIPKPLAALSLRQQVQAAVPSSAMEKSHTVALKALVTATQDSVTSTACNPHAAELIDATVISLTETESTVVRTLYYEGLLTHAARPCQGLRVPNDFMQRYFIDKFAAHLASDTTLRSAAEGFILRGSCAALEAALSAVCAPGLIWQGVFKWHEFDCSQRLVVGVAADPSGTALAVCDRASEAVHVLPWPLPGMPPLQ
jgi:hypothetical protein